MSKEHILSDEEWEEFLESPECQTCHSMMRLMPDCEWDDSRDRRLLVCFDCQGAAFAKALGDVDALIERLIKKTEDFLKHDSKVSLLSYPTAEAMMLHLASLPKKELERFATLMRPGIQNILDTPVRQAHAVWVLEEFQKISKCLTNQIS